MPFSFAIDLLHLVALLAMGGALGFFGGLFGIGGGIIAIPLLALAFGMPQALAQGTALVMMVPNLLVAWWRYSRRHPVPAGQTIGIGLIGTLTTWLMAGVATQLPSAMLRLVFSVFLLALALQLLVRTHRQQPAPNHQPANPRLLPLVGLVGGSSMGLLGVGGGLVATPLMTGCFGLRQAVAQSLSLALVAPSSVIALSAYASAGRVDWETGLPLALSGLFTVSAGVALAHRLPERHLRTAFSWLLLATALWLLLGPLPG